MGFFLEVDLECDGVIDGFMRENRAARQGVGENSLADCGDLQQSAEQRPHLRQFL